jgi:hypothetical protein
MACGRARQHRPGEQLQRLFDGLKLKAWNSSDGVAYGIPHGRGANLLMWRTDR